MPVREHCDGDGSGVDHFLGDIGMTGEATENVGYIFRRDICKKEKRDKR